MVREDLKEEKEGEVSKPFGPLERLLTPVVPDAKRPVNGIDPQAALIKSRIEAASAEQARRSLAIIGNYDSDSDTEDKGKVQTSGVFGLDCRLFRADLTAM